VLGGLGVGGDHDEPAAVFDPDLDVGEAGAGLVVID
jgi:hypothetical protein